jgi:TPR repeat protein
MGIDMRFLFCFMLGLFCLSLPSPAWALSAKDLPAEELKAKNGNVASQVDVGDYYYARRRYAEALEWYRLAARQGQHDARDSIAYMYLTGQGTAQNPLKAYVLTRKILQNDNLYPESKQAKERLVKKLTQQLTPEQLEQAEKLIQQDWEF